MKKNAKLRIILDSEYLEKIKQRAKEEKLSISSYCRRKLNTPSEMARIEYLLLELNQKLDKITIGGRANIYKLANHKEIK